MLNESLLPFVKFKKKSPNIQWNLLTTLYPTPKKRLGIPTVQGTDGSPKKPDKMTLPPNAASGKLKAARNAQPAPWAKPPRMIRWDGTSQVEINIS